MIYYHRNVIQTKYQELFLTQKYKIIFILEFVFYKFTINCIKKYI